MEGEIKMKNYSYKIEILDDEHIIIRDTAKENEKTLTNAAEDVVAEIYEKYGNISIYYLDTMNMLCEMVHENGVFREFIT